MVKLFLKKPSTNQAIVQKVLQLATADNDNPDIRDRAYVYWRLLSGDLEVAKVRVLPALDSIAATLLTQVPTRPSSSRPSRPSPPP